MGHGAWGSGLRAQSTGLRAWGTGLVAECFLKSEMIWSGILFSKNVSKLQGMGPGA